VVTRTGPIRNAASLTAASSDSAAGRRTFCPVCSDRRGIPLDGTFCPVCSDRRGIPLDGTFCPAFLDRRAAPLARTFVLVASGLPVTAEDRTFVPVMWRQRAADNAPIGGSVAPTAAARAIGTQAGDRPVHATASATAATAYTAVATGTIRR
jgi:hypothetical protein